MPGQAPGPGFAQVAPSGVGAAPDDGPPAHYPGRNSSSRLVLGLVLGGLVLVGLAAFVGWRLFESIDALEEEPGGYDTSYGDVIDPENPPEDPPSERGQLPTTSVPAVVDRPNQEAPAATSGEQFRQLECEFTGEAVIDPGISFEGTGSPQRMRLLPGASFDCSDGAERSAGVIELEASFDSLGIGSGVGSGTGRISWSEIAPSAPLGEPGVVESTTGVEIQLGLPVIVVWTTILDGPYTGYNGRLVLRDWEPVMDGAGRIVGVRFARTSTNFGPT